MRKNVNRAGGGGTSREETLAGGDRGNRGERGHLQWGWLIRGIIRGPGNGASFGLGKKSRGKNSVTSIGGNGNPGNTPTTFTVELKGANTRLSLWGTRYIEPI